MSVHHMSAVNQKALALWYWGIKNAYRKTKTSERGAVVVYLKYGNRKRKSSCNLETSLPLRKFNSFSSLTICSGIREKSPSSFRKYRSENVFKSLREICLSIYSNLHIYLNLQNLFYNKMNVIVITHQSNVIEYLVYCSQNFIDRVKV